MVKKIAAYHPQLGPYLAGLIEGDGNICVLKQYRASNNKIRYCYIRT